jgi:ABC-2 type transport system ATP-binding protein
MIELRDLTKAYDQQLALDRVNLSVPPNSVFGLIGGHGAGKSTLLGILATLIEPSSGEVVIGGSSVVRDRLRVRQMIGYLPQEFGVYPDLTCGEYVEFFAACYGIAVKERATLTNDLLQLVDLHHRRDLPADRLTRSMRQRLGLARVLAHDPRVLLLDQPTSSLDPRARVELRELMRELNGMGKTIVLTANNLAEIQDVCTHVALLEDGRLTASGNVDEIQHIAPPHRVIHVRFLGDATIATGLIRAERGVIGVTMANDVMAVGEGLAGVTLLKEAHVVFDGVYADASALLRALMHHGVQVVSFGEEQ